MAAATSESSWRRGAQRVLLYVAVVAVPLATATLIRPHTDDPFPHELGLSLALIGFTIIAVQLVMGARFSWIERPVGLDLVFGFHCWMGVLAVVLLLAHPFLVVSDQKSWRELYGVDVHWFVFFGRAALLLLIANVLLALLRGRLGVPFERWRRLHDVAGGALLACGFVHGWGADVDLARWPMRGLWIAVGSTAVGAFLWHRWIRPAWRRRRRPYTVVAVRREAPRVWTLDMAPPAGAPTDAHLPGQFHFLTFHRGRGLPVEEHPFTISSSPTEPRLLASTIKESGDFTATIGSTAVGDRVAVVGPYGRFSYLLHPEHRDLVFIAGGIGITPFRSMLVHMRDTGADRSVLLLWANRTADDIVFREELDAIAAGERPRVAIVHVLSRPEEGWEGERGHVTAEMIRRHAGERVTASSYWLCGPPPMMRATVAVLGQLGVPAGRILFERFSV